MITLTDAAVAKITDVMLEEPAGSMLRVFVQGGGCSGFEYGFAIEDKQEEDDFEFVYGTVKVLVDSMSSHYLTGAVIDYEEDLMGAGFKIKNPGAESTCGCGSSFSPSTYL
jgi:iron-sulfur cluster insertion protein